MEGAAVASVCYQNQVAFAVVRIISDQADQAASRHFTAQLPLVSKMTKDIVSEILCGDEMQDEKKIRLWRAPRLDSRPDPNSAGDKRLAARPLLQH
jgi:hypothetical protein